MQPEQAPAQVALFETIVVKHEGEPGERPPFVVVSERGHSTEPCYVCRQGVLSYPYYEAEIPVYYQGAYLADDSSKACSEACADKLPKHIKFEEMSSWQRGMNFDSRVFSLIGQEKKRGWIYAFSPMENYPRNTSRDGKWLVFVPVEEVDQWWERIKEGIRQGLLGRLAKIALSARPDRWTGKDRHVICVYTYDSEDKTDVERVRRGLHDIGIDWKLSYKTNAQTELDAFRQPRQIE